MSRDFQLCFAWLLFYCLVRLPAVSFAQENQAPHEGILLTNPKSGRFEVFTTMFGNTTDPEALYAKVLNWVKVKAPVILSGEEYRYDRGDNGRSGEGYSSGSGVSPILVVSLDRVEPYTGHILVENPLDRTIRCILNQFYYSDPNAPAGKTIPGFHNLIFEARIIRDSVVVTVQHQDIQIPKQPDGISQVNPYTKLYWPVERKSWYTKTGEPRAGYNEQKQQYLLFRRQVDTILASLQKELSK